MDAVLFIAFVVCVVLLIIFALAVGFAGGGWKRLVESVGMACVVMALAGCGGGDPEVVIHEMPVPGDGETVYIGDIELVMATETPLPSGYLGISAWVRYPDNSNGVQEVGGCVDLGEEAYQGASVTICVLNDCVGRTSDQTGYASAKFVGPWAAGAVPWSFCVDYEGEVLCVRSSFMQVEE